MTIGGGLSPESGVQPSVLRAIGLTTIVTSLGYGVTLLQQVLYARTLGVNVETDALGASLAWVIGTTGFVGTTLASIFLPQFVRESRRDPVGALELRRRTTSIAIALGGFLMLVTALAAPTIGAILTPGAQNETQPTLARLLTLGAPLEVIWPLIWLAVSTVNARERYVLAAASALLPPIPVIVLLFAGAPTVDGVMLAYTLGALLQLAMLWGLEAESRPKVGPPGKTDIGRGLIPVGAAFALLALVPLEVRGIASLHGEGAVAIADYASRLVLAGQQVLLSGLLAVTFTRWSRDASAQRASPLDSMERTLTLVGLAGVLVAILLPVVSVDLTRLVFAGGRFTSSDAVDVGTFIGWMAPGVAGHMVLMLATRGLLADRRLAPLLVAAASAALVVPIIGLVAQDVWGLYGAAAGYSAGYVIAAAVAATAIWRRRTSPDSPADSGSDYASAVPRSYSLSVWDLESA